MASANIESEGDTSMREDEQNFDDEIMDNDFDEPEEQEVEKKSEKKEKKVKQENDDIMSVSEEPNKYLYRLVGVLVHSGGADSGHYYSYIKERKENGRWLEFNDTTVRPFDFDMLERECFGKPTEGQKVSYVSKDCTNAYLLFYEQVH
jgi:ubiquitin C-terminal hydrolase